MPPPERGPKSLPPLTADSGARRGRAIMVKVAASGGKEAERAVVFARALYERFRQPAHEFTSFAVVGIAGVFITNGVYDLLCRHYGLGPVLSATVATIVAAVFTFLGNRYWSFRARRRTGFAREIIVFAVLNGLGLLIQDAAVAANVYLLNLGHDKLAAFLALNTGIALATLFRFFTYRQFVWIASPPKPAEGPQPPVPRAMPVK
jgi:putative flippase GtrA